MSYTKTKVTNDMRVTINLTKKSNDEITRLMNETGLTKTNVINRAILMYAIIEDLLDKNDRSIKITHSDDTWERVRII